MFGKDMAEALFKFAQQVPMVTVLTDCHDIPWELLFFGTIAEGSFLCEQTVIARQTLESKPPFDSADGANGDSPVSIAICSQIHDDLVEHFTVADKTSVTQLTEVNSLIGETVKSQTSVVVAKSQGLALSIGQEQLDYDTIQAFDFGANSLVFWVTCFDAKGSDEDNDAVAGNIASYCNVPTDRASTAPTIEFPYTFAGQLLTRISSNDQIAPDQTLFDFLEAERVIFADPTAREADGGKWAKAAIFYPFISIFGNPCTPLKG
ncbi:hypothetical protein [uncultured Tateyamaria sp.]|uniref:hypothetical protein n=1 Tax=uncultured Tateyamaria sp. TaxID=455651 RepID=UPI0026331729|nr:hypothetical protein [uncultured Tateyamaria sp.]